VSLCVCRAASVVFIDGVFGFVFIVNHTQKGIDVLLDVIGIG
jgi:hypothetical protein